MKSYNENTQHICIFRKSTFNSREISTNFRLTLRLNFYYPTFWTIFFPESFIRTVRGLALIINTRPLLNAPNDYYRMSSKTTLINTLRDTNAQLLAIRSLTE